MQDPAGRSGGEGDWSARIRTSITRLMEMEEICMDLSKAAEKRKAQEAEQAFRAKVDRLETESEIAHNEHWERLRNVYSTSTAKKMRLTTTKIPASAKESSSWRPSHEALDTLAVAAVTEQSNEPGETATKGKKTKRSRRQDLLPVGEESGTEQKLVQVYDPTLVQAVDKLADKLTQLLSQLQTASDEATAEPILAAAANIALEVTKMRRCEEVAMTRLLADMGDSAGTIQDLIDAEGDASTLTEDVDMTLPGASQDTDDEDENKSIVARHGDVTTDDDPQESTADEEDEEDEEDDADSDEDKVDLSDSASMLRMLQNLPEDEARRHEQFRRSHFERGAIKRAIHECSATDKRAPSVTNVMAIVMAGMTKVFVGEITAEARKIMEKNGETGPIRPRHIREAHRKYYKRRPLARGRNMRRLFR
ncbi:hypothetical protein PHPALM_20025 [Phytophthora palmivora]|uniref:TAFII28-like protein domain-containing protein n=1 Tax=Phytophthora palmivora TaxID=4796 RepID=A0A2P4XFV9_9STRA|nr:hypothetical protein PHPALM_20025 [Phytophthora palmivora]